MPFVPEVELPPVVEFEPPKVELLPPRPPTGVVEFEPAPPVVELPEDEVPVEPAPAAPRVVVRVASDPVAITTVVVPEFELVAVTVAVDAPEAVAATTCCQLRCRKLVALNYSPRQNWAPVLMTCSAASAGQDSTVQSWIPLVNSGFLHKHA